MALCKTSAFTHYGLTMKINYTPQILLCLLFSVDDFKLMWRQLVFSGWLLTKEKAD